MYELVSSQSLADVWQELIHFCRSESVTITLSEKSFESKQTELQFRSTKRLVGDAFDFTGEDADDLQLV